jgi:peptide/nickel transport system substrate-binding protein
MLYDPFIDLDDSMKPVAVLAKSWESNAAGSEWIFHLREGVTFHDGSPLTAEDVVYTYRRLLDPATHSPGQAELGTIQSGNFRSTQSRKGDARPPSLSCP